MDKVTSYLRDSLGLRVSVQPWAKAGELPIFLRDGIEYAIGSYRTLRFLFADCGNESSLTNLKRIAGQVSKFTRVPVVLVTNSIDARKRKALVQQQVAFVVPGRQVFLPFIGFASQESLERRALGSHLSAGAQSVLVTLISNPKLDTMAQLCARLELSTSAISRAVTELEERGLVTKIKKGREVIISYDTSKNHLFRASLPVLADPVAYSFYAKKTKYTEHLPDVGESALSNRTRLAPPAITQKGIARKDLDSLAYEEISEGELDDGKTTQIQVWQYDPLVAGQAAVDNVSLAVSFLDCDDERIRGELNQVFGEPIWV